MITDTAVVEEASDRPGPSGRRRGVFFLGPAFVAAVAYVDPGNFATNFSAGAVHGYALAWVIVLADVMAILVQYLAAKAGIATGMSLPSCAACTSAAARTRSSGRRRSWWRWRRTSPSSSARPWGCTSCSASRCSPPDW